MSKLIRWNTPFTDEFGPSVGLFIFPDHEDKRDLLTAIVTPEGTDKYPKYLVRFGGVLGFTCLEEAFAPERGYTHAPIETDEKICAWQWIDSPWLESYMEGAPLFGYTELFHYIIFGGDNIVEVITSNPPEIERVDQETLFTALLVI